MNRPSAANKLYALLYSTVIPSLFNQRMRRIPFSMSMTFLVNRLLARDIEEELVGWESEVKREVDVTPDSVVFDVGANIGQWTLWFARQTRGLVVAFEPDEEAFFWLRRNTAKYGNVMPLKLAAWREDKMLSLNKPHVSFMSSVSEAQSKNMVTARTLDGVAKDLRLSKIDLTKMDVEGAEADVLAGAPNVLRMCKQVLVEVHRMEQKRGLTDTLNSHGFNVRTVRERWLLASKLG